MCELMCGCVFIRVCGCVKFYLSLYICKLIFMLKVYVKECVCMRELMFILYVN